MENPPPRQPSSKRKTATAAAERNTVGKVAVIERARSEERLPGGIRRPPLREPAVEREPVVEQGEV